MEKTSKQYLMNAFGNESQAFMRYQHFADQAEKENLSHIARLFRAIAYSSFIQAGNHYSELEHFEEKFTTSSTAILGMGDTRKNLRLAIIGNDFELTEMYPVYLEIARLQGERGIERSLTWAYLVKRVQKKILIKVKDTAQRGSGPKPGHIQVCRVCGYTRMGEVPNKCPLCKITREHFATFI